MPSQITRDQLREMRSRVGWTQRDAGDAIGRRERVYSSYERGEVPFPDEMARLFMFEVACAQDPELRAYVEQLARGTTKPRKRAAG
jgi:DNA-binding XRE family transcriptional regulator